jgi:hypothetical protein
MFVKGKIFFPAFSFGLNSVQVAQLAKFSHPPLITYAAQLMAQRAACTGPAGVSVLVMPELIPSLSLRHRQVNPPLNPYLQRNQTRILMESA